MPSTVPVAIVTPSDGTFWGTLYALSLGHYPAVGTISMHLVTAMVLVTKADFVSMDSPYCHLAILYSTHIDSLMICHDRRAYIYIYITKQKYTLWGKFKFT